MKRSILLLLSLLAILPMLVAAPGVTIIGHNFDCVDVPDGICPADYGASPLCSTVGSGVCDGDCNTCCNKLPDPGETGIDVGGPCPAPPPTCNDGDIDGLEQCDSGVCCTAACQWESTTTVCATGADICAAGSPSCSIVHTEQRCAAYTVPQAVAGCTGAITTVTVASAGANQACQNVPLPTIVAQVGACLAPSVCGNNIREGAEQCDGGPCCVPNGQPGACTLRAANYVCNTGANVCAAGVPSCGITRTDTTCGAIAAPVNPGPTVCAGPTNVVTVSSAPNGQTCVGASYSVPGSGPVCGGGIACAQIALSFNAFSASSSSNMIDGTFNVHVVNNAAPASLAVENWMSDDGNTATWEWRGVNRGYTAPVTNQGYVQSIGPFAIGTTRMVNARINATCVGGAGTAQAISAPFIPVCVGGGSCLPSCTGLTPSTVALAPSTPSQIVNNNVVLTATATTFGANPQIHLDTDANPSAAEVNAPAPVQSGLATKAVAGSYTYYANVTDECDNGGVVQTRTSVTATTVVQFTADPAPTISLVTTNASRYLAFDLLTATLSITDNTPGTTYTFDYGDGGPVLSGTTLAAGLQQFNIPAYTYAVPAFPAQWARTITVTATDSTGQISTHLLPMNLISLPCVSGSAFGTGTYTGAAAECCAGTCAGTNTTGGVSCYAANACHPTGTASVLSQSLCVPVGPAAPVPDPDFLTRETDENRCEVAAGPPTSCSQYTWDDLNNVCCGNNLNEVTAQWTFQGALGHVASNNQQIPPGATENVCCAAPNVCYSDAFTAGGSAGCFGGGESSVAECTNHNDDDCDGLVDGVDPSCQATVQGMVTLLDQYGAGKNGYNVDVYISGSNAQTKTGTSGSYSLTAPIGTQQIYARILGWATEVQTINIPPGGLQGVDFVLDPRRCNADCSNDQGLCDMSCIGVGGCQPTAAELTTLQACHPAGAAFGLPAGTELITNKCDANAPVTGGTCANGLQPGTVETVICCTIPGSVRPLPKVNAQDVNLGTIETLVKYTRSVNYNGEIVNIVIATW